MQLPRAGFYELSVGVPTAAVLAAGGGVPFRSALWVMIASYISILLSESATCAGGMRLVELTPVSMARWPTARRL